MAMLEEAARGMATGRGSASGSVAAAPPSLSALLLASRAEVDRVFGEMPESRLEARRLITRELGFEPKPEALQTIVLLANAAVGRDPVGELTRRVLALRILADRELKEFLDSKQLGSSAIRRSLSILPQLLRTARAVEEDVANAETSLDVEGRDLLLQVGSCLALPVDLLFVAQVLGPRLLRLVRAEEQGDVRSVAPTLSSEEAAMFRALVHGGGEEGLPSRVCIDAVALRTLIEDDLAAWERFPKPAAGEGEAARQDRLERLARDKVVYHVLTSRLQAAQDVALVAGLNDFAEEMRGVQRRLFSVYLKLAPLVRQGAEGASDAPVKSADDGSALQRILEESAEVEAVAQAEAARGVSREQVLLDAMKEMREPAPEPRSEASTQELRRERRRLRKLIAVAGVLFVACVAIYVALAPPAAEPIEIPQAELSPALTMSNAKAIGPLMYAEVSLFLWEDMSPEERRRRVEEVGRDAAGRGFESVHLVDENRREIGRWTLSEGAVLVDSGPTSP